MPKGLKVTFSFKLLDKLAWCRWLNILSGMVHVAFRDDTLG